MPVPFSPVELLSPARDAAVGRVAIDHGADAVYIGGPAFGARFEASNHLKDIEELCRYAHRYHSRVYMTLNTLIFDDELENAQKMAWAAYEMGVDALIVQDMALLEMDLPPIDLHASTQCDVRTPEKAAFLDSVGFSQIVLARELTLDEIRSVRARVPRARLEYFVHGALCVSYSGQCYLSCSKCARSANRGECSQPCRLPYSVIDFAGHELVHNKHVLSLKDNCQLDSLEALIEAGVSSFKIEGRLKDADYVKNITALYRKKLDAILEARKWEKSSLGQCEIHFEPNPEKTFHRGATSYFIAGRQDAMASLNTPKSFGEKIGSVANVNRRSQLVEVDVVPGVELNNADGFVYFDDRGELSGLAANRADRIGRSRYRLTFYENLKKHPAISHGVTLFRNKDHAFNKLLESDGSSVRKIPVAYTLFLNSQSLTLRAETAGYSFEAMRPVQAQKAKNPQATEANVIRHLQKTGETLFVFGSVRLTGETELFVPASILNDLRREVLEGLEKTVAAGFQRESRLERTAYTDVSSFATDYRANVSNRLSRAFWEKAGLKVTEPAFELGKTVTAETELMRCRYCIRREIGLCPRLVKGDAQAKERFKEMNAGHLKPEPLTLLGPRKERFVARFDCRACEMTIHREG